MKTPDEKLVVKELARGARLRVGTCQVADYASDAPYRILERLRGIYACNVYSIIFKESLATPSPARM